MRPGTPHIVITVEDCFAVGGHFYNRRNLTATLHALICEHFNGKYITNVEHSNAGLILFKMVNDYLSKLDDSG